MEIKTVKIRDAVLKNGAVKLFLKRWSQEIEKDGTLKKKGIVVNMLLNEYYDLLEKQK